MQEAHGPATVAEFLIFTMGQEEYGLDIIKVQEIRGYETVTQLANTPDYFKGVINLRGVIVPVIDMRIKLKLGTVSYNEMTIVIVLNLRGKVVGMVVDGVSDVATLTPDQIRAAPQLGNAIDGNYITGLGTVDDRMLILVDIDGLMANDDIGMADRIAA